MLTYNDKEVTRKIRKLKKMVSRLRDKIANDTEATEQVKQSRQRQLEQHERNLRKWESELEWDNPLVNARKAKNHTHVRTDSLYRRKHERNNTEG